MKVALCQMDIAWQDVSGNLAKIRRMFGEAKGQGAELIVFPEMCLTGFSMNPEEAALPPESSGLRELLDLTLGSQALVFAGVAVQRPQGIFNECWMMRGGALLDIYQKVNLFSFGGEQRVYRPGERLLVLPEQGRGLSPLICYDLRFSELFLKLAEEVTGAYVVIANWPSARREQWKALLRARALDTQAYVIGVNRTGSGGGLEYAGESTVFDPAGRQLSDIRTDEAMMIVDLDLDDTLRLRSRFPVLTDRARLAKVLPAMPVERVLGN